MVETPQLSTGMASKPLRVELPDPQFVPVVASERDGSSPEAQAETVPRLEEEEAVHAVVGPSMSRAQMHMMSPMTPAAEKAAVLAGLGGSGLFHGVPENMVEEQESVATTENTVQTSAHRNEPQTPTSPADQVDLPSPWRASPKPFEKETNRSGQPIGPMGMLADLNVKRYITNLNLPLPRTPLFKDFSVPSLASVFGSVREHSPLRRGTRQKRASTFSTRAGFPPYDADESIRHGFSHTTTATSIFHNGRDVAEAHRGRQSSSDARPLSAERQRSIIPNQSSGHSQQHPMLHRSTSDQSLLLRRAGSTKSSLGDDGRWIAVHEQVNSRRKAIMDTLQDSKLPRPSLPDLPLFNLGAFRPDFFRPRASSEAKQLPARLAIEGNSLSREINMNALPDSRVQQAAAEVNGAQAPYKVTNNMLSHLDCALEHLTGDIVVMGGYRGSVLRSAKPPNRQLWVPVKVGLNIRKVNLEVGLEPEDEENMEDSIIPSGMLSHIGPVDMGRRLLKRLRSCTNALEGRLRVHDYGYDWRLSPHLLSRKLIAFLEHLPSNAMDVPPEERGATVLAHSMGGLITRHAVNRRPELFAGVVYAGVPQHCVNILGPVRNGDDVLLSSKVLTAQVNFTMRSTYVLLPDNGQCFINKDTKEEYPVDFFDVEHWKQHAFSPCIAPIQPPASSEQRKGLLGSLSDNLPSLPSLPLPSRKSSPAPNEAKQFSTETTVHKLSNLTDSDPSTARALDPHFSSVSNASTTIPYTEAYKYLSRTLNQTIAFRSALHPFPALQQANHYPPFACLYATNTPTVSRARVTSREAIRCADAYDDLQFASGDGVCLAKAAQLPEGYMVARGRRVKTEKGHVGLLGDLEAVGRCLHAVGRARQAGVGMGVATVAVSKVQEAERNVHGMS